MIRRFWIICVFFCVVPVSFADQPDPAEIDPHGVLERVRQCGEDADCLRTLATEFKKRQQPAEPPSQASAIPRLAAVPCAEIETGGGRCVPIEMRIRHAIRTRRKECGKPRFEFRYTYEGLGFGQLFVEENSAFRLFASTNQGDDAAMKISNVEGVIMERDKKRKGCPVTKTYKLNLNNVRFMPNQFVAYFMQLTNLPHMESSGMGTSIVQLVPPVPTLKPGAAVKYWGMGLATPTLGPGGIMFNELQDAGMYLSEEDAQALADGGEVELKKEWQGESDLQGEYQNDVQLSFRGHPNKCKLEIVSPNNNEKIVYSDAKPSIASVRLRAKVTPKKYSKYVQWNIKGLKNGSKMHVQPRKAKGDAVDVTLKELPRKNTGFGKKLISASIRKKGCKVRANRTVQLFFPRDASNNPDGKVPNWFYYWKQTKAGKSVGSIKYILQDSDCARGSIAEGGFYRQWGKNVYFTNSVLPYDKPWVDYFFICDLNRKLGPRFLLSDAYIKDSTGKIRIGQVTGIDTFAIIVAHEDCHYMDMMRWKPYRAKNKQEDGLTSAQKASMHYVSSTTEADGIKGSAQFKLDKDSDLLFDADEAKGKYLFAADPTKHLSQPDIYEDNARNRRQDPGDDELNCRASELKWKVGSADKEDWAKPGKQFK